MIDWRHTSSTNTASAKKKRRPLFVDADWFGAENLRTTSVDYLERDVTVVKVGCGTAKTKAKVFDEMFWKKTKGGEVFLRIQPEVRFDTRKNRPIYVAMTEALHSDLQSLSGDSESVLKYSSVGVSMAAMEQDILWAE